MKFLKLIHKIITRLFWGGYDLRIGLDRFIPIPVTHQYLAPIVIAFVYIAITGDPTTISFWQDGWFAQVLVCTFLFIMYVIFIHFGIWSVKWDDLTPYQRWIYGNAILKAGAGLPQNMTDAQIKEWMELDKYAREA